MAFGFGRWTKEENHKHDSPLLIFGVIVNQGFRPLGDHGAHQARGQISRFLSLSIPQVEIGLIHKSVLGVFRKKRGLRKNITFSS